MGKEKNIRFLLDVFRDVLTVRPDTVFIIVGDGPDREALQAEAEKKGIGIKVIFTGALPREHVINAYAGADLFIFASVTETQGLVLGEAKAAGLPAVAVEALGAAEMVTDGVDGFLTPLSREVFTARVLQLLENDALRREMSANARRRAGELSSANMAIKLVSAYERTIARKKCRNVV